MHNPLFRPSVITARRRKLYGNVTLWQPMALVFYSLLAIFAIGASITFLAIGKYSRKETVVGWIVPQGGLSQIYATRGGVVAQALVHQGQLVTAGQPIAKMTIDLSGDNGAIAPIQRAQTNARIAELAVQANAAQSRYIAEDNRLNAQSSGIAAKYTQDDARLAGAIVATTSEAAHLAPSREMASQNVTLEQRTLDRMRQAQGAGAISPLEIDRQSQAVIAAGSRLDDVERQIQNRRASASDIAAQRASLRAEYQSQLSEIAKQRALIAPSLANDASQIRAAKSQLESGLADLNVADGYIIRAPISGRIASFNVRVGEAASQNAPIAAIMANNSIMEAELLVPTRSAGFVLSGMKVQVMVDAYPYQKFGVIQADVREITRVAFRPGEINAPIDFKEPVYRVRAKLAVNGLRTYGTAAQLQSGMTLRADIITDTRSLLAWLLDPLLAARARAVA